MEVWHVSEGRSTDRPVAYDAAKRLHAAAAEREDHDFAAHWAGQGAPLARELPAGELVSRLLQEWRDGA